VSAGLWVYDGDKGTYRFTCWTKPIAASNGYPS
jgi:hypothetical protein